MVSPDGVLYVTRGAGSSNRACPDVICDINCFRFSTA